VRRYHLERIVEPASARLVHESGPANVFELVPRTRVTASSRD